MKKPHWASEILPLALIAFSSPSFSYNYKIVDLGAIVGPVSTAISISNDGRVVGYNGSQGYIWRIGNANAEFLGTLPGGYQSNAYGINSSGQAIGWASFSSPSRLTGFVYSNGIMQDLSLLAGLTTDYLSPSAINAKGDIVGWGNIPSGHFLYSMSEGKLIDKIPSFQGSFYGINDVNQIVGQTGLSGQGGQAVLVQGATITLLGTLGGAYSVATGINNSGLVIGTSYTSGTDSSSQRAFLYDGTMHDLGTLGGGYSFVGDINNHGVVVGSSRMSGGLFHGFIYKNGEMRDINDFVDPSTGIVISDVRGINDNGEIVGIGTKNGNIFNAFVLIPVPEPSSLFLLIVGLITLLVGVRYPWPSRGEVNDA